MSRTVAAVPDADIARMVPDMDRHGCGCLPGFFAPPVLAALRALVDRLPLDNAAARFLLRTLLKLQLLPLVRIKPVNRDICFFRGYRSIRINQACVPDEIGATALFHYADPHAADRRTRKAGRVAA